MLDCAPIVGKSVFCIYEDKDNLMIECTLACSTLAQAKDCDARQSIDVAMICHLGCVSKSAVSYDH